MTWKCDFKFNSRDEEKILGKINLSSRGIRWQQPI